MDQSIINKCKKGCRKSQEIVFKEIYPKMMGICMRYARDKEEAEDFLHDGMLKVFVNISKFDNTGSFEGWVRKIIRNDILDKFRTRKRDPMEFTEPIDERDQDVENIEEIEGIPTNVIMEFIQELSPGYRMVFNLHIFEELTHKEIGKLLDVSINTSKTNYFKAKKQILEKCNEWIHKHIEQYA